MAYRLQHKTYNLNSGQAALTIVVMSLFVALAIMFGISALALSEKVKVRTDIESKLSYYTAEAGIEDIIYRLKNAKQVAPTEYLTLNGGTATAVTTDTPTGKEVTVSASVNNSIRKVLVDVTLGTGISFHYGIQAGNGGFTLANSSSVIGNVFAGGSVLGSGNTIDGDVVSAGFSGLIDGVHATGAAYAHNIRKTTSKPTTIDKDAYYVNKDAAVTVNGILHPNSPDLGPADLPISDVQISQWENDAVAGGTLSSAVCDTYDSPSNTCTISTDKTLGPKKIPFNLVVKGTGSGGTTLTVSGPLWIAGNITTSQNATIKMATSLGSQNVAIIADNNLNQSNSSMISVENGSSFVGSGSVGSFVFMISQNKDAEGGTTSCLHNSTCDAILIGNSANTLVAYASHGQITISQSNNNNVSVKAVTAYKIVLSQSAGVTYDTGLPSTIFSSGPSGGYDISNWREVQ